MGDDDDTARFLAEYYGGPWSDLKNPAIATNGMPALAGAVSGLPGLAMTNPQPTKQWEGLADILARYTPHQPEWLNTTQQAVGNALTNPDLQPLWLAASFMGSRSEPFKLTPEQFGDYLSDKYGARVDLAQNSDVTGGHLNLQHIEVPKDQRRQGIGSSIVNEINDYADANGKTVVLSPASRDDNFGTTSRNRLIDWYKSLGYTHNKGRNKDYRISEGMYRRPQDFQNSDSQ